MSERRNNHMMRMERIIAGALKSSIDAHGAVTPELIGSAVKRIVGALVADGQTRVAVPVMTRELLERLERVCAVLDALPEMSEQLSCELAVLRDENHPEGWSEIEFVEHADAPHAIVHHHGLARPEKTYTRKRDGKRVDLENGPEPLKQPVERKTVTCD